MIGGSGVNEVVLNDTRSSVRQQRFMNNVRTVLFEKDYSCCFVSREKRQLTEGRPTGRFLLYPESSETVRKESQTRNERQAQSHSS